ncbi:hypothetical protein Micbo1qcDRAFT_158115 [Microdochium bolleyi]|uniref:Uncharacterized protein n=1 Tax=Microdochium bolleyi TaxID=196109 RepID=A0A136JFM7_9PEZI|nr:hypothetical protein Micbo1qcDRAFT_158115 [Microdochium bolleyi]
MATFSEQTPTLRRDSPSPETTPSIAMNSKLRIDRSLSGESYASSTDGSFRDSLGSSGAYSRQSSASYSRLSDVSFASSRQSTASFEKAAKRRGYSRPQATDFAASAKQRESVLSLGSINHLQYYFARTGLLDGKGAQFARKKNPRATLDLSDLDPSTYLPTKSKSSSAEAPGITTDSGVDATGHPFDGSMVESPIEDHDGFYYDEYEAPDPEILPPTTSTYIHREKPVPKPPTIDELKLDLGQALDTAMTSLRRAMAEPEDTPPRNDVPSPGKTQGWFEIQGMQVLDVMTLAIRAAKMYYTSHEYPDRLDAIKSERAIRADLLAVMEVLKHMATRNFAGGLREDEYKTMSSWIDGIRAMVQKDEAMEKAERDERSRWSWLEGDWTGREIEREIAFLRSMDEEGDQFPSWTPISDAHDVPTPFLAYFQDGLKLIKLHNAAVKKSPRRFGAIPTFHVDTQKPYRRAENLRFWIKAAELRFEILLKVDVMGVVYNSSRQVWVDFEAAIMKWCKAVREEITAEWSKS